MHTKLRLQNLKERDSLGNTSWMGGGGGLKNFKKKGGGEKG